MIYISNEFKITMNSRIFIFTKTDFKIIIFGTVIGGIFQVICWKYLKDHPELLDNQNPVNETKKPGLRRFLPRGGALIEITGAKFLIDIVGVITFISKKGVLIGITLATSSVVIKKIPLTVVSTVLRNALPPTHSNWGKFEKTKFFIVDGKKIYLDQCDQNLKYLFKMLSNQKIPFEDKKQLTYSILVKHLDLRTPNGRLRFILCIITILHIFAINDISNYFIMMQNLIKAVKEGKISKRLARLIIRQLIRKGVEVDPELIRVAS